MWHGHFFFQNTHNRHPITLCYDNESVSFFQFRSMIYVELECIIHCHNLHVIMRSVLKIIVSERIFSAGMAWVVSIYWWVLCQRANGLIPYIDYVLVGPIYLTISPLCWSGSFIISWWLSAGVSIVGLSNHLIISVPDCKVYGANMGPIWGRQDPGGPHVGPINLAIWGVRVRQAGHICLTIISAWESGPNSECQPVTYCVKGILCSRPIFLILPSAAYFHVVQRILDQNFFHRWLLYFMQI